MTIQTFELHHGSLDRIESTSDYVYTPNWGFYKDVPCTFIDANLHSAVRETDKWFKEKDIPFTATPSTSILAAMRARMVQ